MPEPDQNITRWEICRDQEIVYPAEHVDTETNGKKSRGGHFHSHETDSEIFFEVTKLDSAEAAEKLLTEKAQQATPGNSGANTLRVRDAGDNIIGSYRLFFSHTKEGVRNYHLLWTKNDTLYSVSSENLRGVEDVKSRCLANNI